MKDGATDLKEADRKVRLFTGADQENNKRFAGAFNGSYKVFCDQRFFNWLWTEVKF